ncbi:MAG: capsular biosynthesis protein, partial [Helicobacter sp.]|nr:capsular biosynthesis protein [Helicobacter sp.]
MILIASAKYLPNEFQMELGKLPPSFLPIGAKRLYEYQAALFKPLGEKIVLSLPKSFILDEIDKDKLESLKIEILSVPDELSLGESIVYCLNMNLPLKESVRILHGDTYFNALDFYENSLVITQVENNYDWEFFDSSYVSANNIVASKDSIVCGYFEIANPYYFIQSILRFHYSYILGIKEYSKAYPFFVVENKSWVDLGFVASYFNFKKQLTTQRAFNNLQIKNGYFVKSSSLDNKILGEIEWFKRFPLELSLNVPRFVELENASYKTEYLYLNTLQELFVFGRLPHFVWDRIFKNLKSFLKELHSFKAEGQVDFDFCKKTQERLCVFLKENNFSLDSSWEAFGLKVSLEKMLLDINNAISDNASQVFIHGDFCFSNIMYDFKANDIKVFDPRGVDFSGNITPFGDFRYDVAKLAHSVLGLYDFIIAGFFKLNVESQKINFEIKIPPLIQSVQAAFLEIFSDYDKRELYALLVHLFLSMLPLHSDNKRRQMALFANAFRLYFDFIRMQ